jgi:excisionase family DNA binding protein
MTETIDSDECAEMLRCHVSQVEEMARSGDIPGLKIGRSWLFVRHDLLSYLAERARFEAQERRAKRQPNITPIVKPRHRTPPALQTAR